MLIWNGQPVPGTEHVRSFADDPRRIPDWSRVATRRWRGGIRREAIDTVGVHTWKAVRPRDGATLGLVHFDPQRHHLRAAEVISGHKSAREKRAYHVYVDHDGTITQCADPAGWWTYHGAKNDRSIGIGIAQGSRARKGAAPDALVTLEAVDAAAALIELLWRAGLIVPPPEPPTPFPVETITFCGWRPPPAGRAKPVSQTIAERTVMQLWELHGRLVLGHCHCGTKTHDPGEHVWARLGARPGWRQVWPQAA